MTLQIALCYARRRENSSGNFLKPVAGKYNANKNEDTVYLIIMMLFLMLFMIHTNVYILYTTS